MLVHRDLEQLPSFKNAVITIGTFDGVHCGHRQIIEQLREEALKCKGESVIITFDPHPRQMLFPQKNDLHLLTTLEEKIFLLNQQQIDHLVIVPFTRSFSQLPAAKYVTDFLVNKFHPHVIIIGYDHHFGHNREGDMHLLHSMEHQYGFRVVEIPVHVVHDLAVSSTKIRKYLEAGNVKLANELLDYSYFISGTVIHGDKRGRALGFPTANIRLEDHHKLIPAEGVYATKIDIPSPVSHLSGGSPITEPPAILTLSGATNIGRIPTFGGKEQRTEVYIFDFNRDIYGEKIRISFCDFIRPDQKFENAEALVTKMHEDILKVKNILKHTKT